jgi:hypothetical protein
MAAITLAEFARPPSHGFVADDDATGGQQLLHHAQIERKEEIQLDGVADDLGWESIAGVACGSGCRHPTRLPILAHPRKPPRRPKLRVPTLASSSSPSSGSQRRDRPATQIEGYPRQEDSSANATLCGVAVQFNPSLTN